jgi:hypothetical protein
MGFQVFLPDKGLRNLGVFQMVKLKEFKKCLKTLIRA